MKTVAAAVTTLALVTAFAGTAHATERRPLRARDQRTTELLLDRYQKPFVVERERTELEKHAIFSAEPQAIEDNAIMLFEISSVSGDKSTPRWSCIAIGDVAECLGRAVKIRYLPADEKMRLTIIAKPRDSAEGLALIQQRNRTELVSR